MLAGILNLSIDAAGSGDEYGSIKLDGGQGGCVDVRTGVTSVDVVRGDTIEKSCRETARYKSTGGGTALQPLPIDTGTGISGSAVNLATIDPKDPGNDVVELSAGGTPDGWYHFRQVVPAPGRRLTLRITGDVKIRTQLTFAPTSVVGDWTDPKRIPSLMVMAGQPLQIFPTATGSQKQYVHQSHSGQVDFSPPSDATDSTRGGTFVFYTPHWGYGHLGVNVSGGDGARANGGPGGEAITDLSNAQPADGSPSGVSADVSANGGNGGSGFGSSVMNGGAGGKGGVVIGSGSARGGDGGHGNSWTSDKTEGFSGGAGGDGGIVIGRNGSTEGGSGGNGGGGAPGTGANCLGQIGRPAGNGGKGGAGGASGVLVRTSDMEKIYDGGGRGGEGGSGGRGSAAGTCAGAAGQGGNGGNGGDGGKSFPPFENGGRGGDPGAGGSGNSSFPRGSDGAPGLPGAKDTACQALGPNGQCAVANATGMLPAQSVSAANGKWTILIYAAVDDAPGKTIESRFIGEVLQPLEQVNLSGAGINVLLQLDRSEDASELIPQDAETWGRWTDTRRGRIIFDDDGDKLSTVLIPGPTIYGAPEPAELNTGDPEYLDDFIRWGIAAAPAEHYLLIIASHGAGVRGLAGDATTPREPFGEYYTYTDKLDMAELRNVFESNFLTKIDVLVQDNCLMQTAEVLTEINQAGDAPDWVVGAQALTGFKQWNINVWLEALKNYLQSNPQMPPAELARVIYENTNNDSASVANMNLFDEIPRKMEDYAASVIAHATQEDWDRIGDILRAMPRTNNEDVEVYALGTILEKLAKKFSGNQNPLNPSALQNAIDHAFVHRHGVGLESTVGVFLPNNPSDWALYLRSSLVTDYSHVPGTPLHPALAPNWRKFIVKATAPQAFSSLFAVSVRFEDDEPEQDFGGTVSSAAQLFSGTAASAAQEIVDGQIGRRSNVLSRFFDTDLFRFSVSGRASLKIEAFGGGEESDGLEPMLALYRIGQAEPVLKPVVGIGGVASVQGYVPPAGDYVLEVKSIGRPWSPTSWSNDTSGSYRLSVTRTSHSIIDLPLTPLALRVSFGFVAPDETAAAVVQVRNSGFLPIDVSEIKVAGSSSFHLVRNESSEAPPWFVSAGETVGIPLKVLGNAGPIIGDLQFFIESQLTPIAQIHLIANPAYQNRALAVDVNDDTLVVAGDALAVINNLNAFGARSLEDVLVPPAGTPYIDTNGDYFLSPSDALNVINYINAHPPAILSPGFAAEGGLTSQLLSNGGEGDPSKTVPLDAFFAWLAVDDGQVGTSTLSGLRKKGGHNASSLSATAQ